MNAASTLPTTSATTPAVSSAAGVEASGRLPVLFFFVAGTLWLIVGAALSLVASIQIHTPDFLSGSPWLTFGRVRPAAWNAVLYGFACQAAFAIALWLIAKLGRARVAGPIGIFIAGKLWNLGVALGVFGILAGDSTGYELLEMPRSAAAVLLLAYVAIGMGAVLTLHQREERELHVSQWFLLAALLCFPWLLSTALVLLLAWPVPGVVQHVVNGWVVNGLLHLWLAPVALAAHFFFLPRAAGRPLHSGGLAHTAFWLLLLIGGWCGLSGTAPVPMWITSLSTAAGVLLLVPMFAVVVNLHHTGAGQWSRVWQDSTGRFLIFAVIAYAGVVLGGAVTGVPAVAEFTQFTHFETAQTHLFLFGAFGLAALGALVHIAPRLLGRDELPSAGLSRLTFWGAVLGTILTVGPLSLGGLLQGLALAENGAVFAASIKAARPWLQLASLGNALWLVAAAALLANLSLALAESCRALCGGAPGAGGPARSRKSGGGR